MTLVSSHALFVRMLKFLLMQNWHWLTWISYALDIIFFTKNRIIGLIGYIGGKVCSAY